MTTDNLNESFQTMGKLADEVAEVIRITVEALKPLVELARKDKRYKRVFYLATYGKKPRTRKKNANRVKKIFWSGK